MQWLKPVTTFVATVLNDLVRQLLNAYAPRGTNAKNYTRNRLLESCELTETVE